MTKKPNGARGSGKHRVVLRSSARRAARRTSRARGASDVPAAKPSTPTPPATILRAPGAEEAEILGQLASDVASIALGFAVVAKRASNETTAEAAGTLEMVHGAIAGEVARVALSRGGSAPRIKASCGDRLRWEWLASSSRWLEGGPEARLLAECERLAQSAMALALTAVAVLPAELRHVVAALATARAASASLVREGHLGSAAERRGTAAFAGV